MKLAIKVNLLVMLISLFAFSAVVAQGQNTNVQYRQWQRAQREAQQQHRQYMRTRSIKDYRQWQRAEARARTQHLQYQRAANVNNRRGRGRYTVGGRYRVNRRGRIFYTDSRGAEALRFAVNHGYEMGFQHGRLDRERSRRFRYNNDVVYERATNGFRSRVPVGDFQYYFREGYRRGYEDGYYNRFRYGQRSGNSYSVLGNVLGSILDMVTDNN